MTRTCRLSRLACLALLLCVPVCGRAQNAAALPPDRSADLQVEAAEDGTASLFLFLPTPPPDPATAMASPLAFPAPGREVALPVGRIGNGRNRSGSGSCRAERFGEMRWLGGLAKAWFVSVAQGV